MKPYPKTPVAFFMHFAKKQKDKAISIIILSTIGFALSRATPLIFSRMVDVLSLNSSGFHTTHLLFILLTLMAGCGAMSFIIRFYMDIRYIAVFEPIFETQITREATNYILDHSAGYLHDNQTGKLAAYVGKLSNYTTGLFWLFLYGFYRPVLFLLISLGMMIWVNPWLAIVAVFWLALFTGVLISTKQEAALYTESSEKDAIVTGTVIDSITNSLLVKSFASKKHENTLLDSKLFDARLATTASLKRAETRKFWQHLMGLLLTTVLTAFAIYLKFLDKVSTGDVVLILMLSNSMQEQFSNIVHEIRHWIKAKGHLENALKVISHPHDIVDHANAKNITVSRGKVHFDNVTFAYKKGMNVFKNFSLTIQPGEKIGLVGVSGSGKSSLISLLMRFYDIQGGAIKIDGQNIAAVTQNSLHNAMAVIPQDSSLFHRTLMENIRYGRPDATDEEVFEAARQAYADTFIRDTMDGYNSLVGDRGVKLSGGQRQRISIARAILKNAPILVLDEATSALDSESEQYIHASMKALMKGKTVIAIAHRLSTLKEMDRIVVMSNGEIIEEGPPNELIKKTGGKYAQLWEMQSTAHILQE